MKPIPAGQQSTQTAREDWESFNLLMTRIEPRVHGRFAKPSVSGYSFNHMRFVTVRRGTGLSWVSILGIACIALVLLTGILHVSHTHPNGQVDQTCSLCVTAHQAVQITIAVTMIVSSGPLTWYALDRYTPVPRQRFLLKLANRPPPVPAAFVA